MSVTQVSLVRYLFVFVFVALPPKVASGDFFFTGSLNRGITRIDERTGQIVQVFATTQEDGFRDFRGMALGPDGLLYVSGRENFSSRFERWGVFRFDPLTGEYLDTFIQDGPLNWIDFGPDGSLYAVNSWSDNLVQYDGTTGDLLRTVISSNHLQFGVGTFAVGKHGDLFARTDVSMLARYDLATGERIGPLTDLEEFGLSGYRFDQMSFGPEGELYAAYNYNFRDTVKEGGVLAFDSMSGELLGSVLDDLPAFGARNGGSLGLAFGPEGNLFIGSQHADAILQFDGLSLEQTHEYPIAGISASATYIVFLTVPEPTVLFLLLLGFITLLQTRVCHS